MPAHAAIYSLENGVRYLQQYGADRIGAHVEALVKNSSTVCAPRAGR